MLSIKNIKRILLVSYLIAELGVLEIACLPLNLNTIYQFTITNAQNGAGAFTFTNAGLINQDPYLVVNFNSFDLSQSDARLPLVTVSASSTKDEEENYFYYSNLKSGWTFDENLLVVPLLEAEKFIISISWKDSSSKGTSIDCLVGVFSGYDLTFKPNFFAPIIVKEKNATMKIKYDLSNSVEKEKSHILFVKPCHGKLSKVVIMDDTTEISSYSNENELNEGVFLPSITSGKLIVLLESDAQSDEVAMAKVGLSSYNPKLFDIGPLASYTPSVKLFNGIIRWDSIENEEETEKFDTKTSIYIDQNPSSLIFKMNCGFDMSIFASPFPTNNKDIKTRPIIENLGNRLHKGYEFGFNSSELRTELHAVNLTAELPFRYGAMNSDILEHKFEYYIKKVFYAKENTKKHFFYYLTVTASSVDAIDRLERKKGRTWMQVMWELIYKTAIVLAMGAFFWYRCKVRKLQAIPSNYYSNEEERNKAQLTYTKVDPSAQS